MSVRQNREAITDMKAQLIPEERAAVARLLRAVRHWSKDAQMDYLKYEKAKADQGAKRYRRARMSVIDA